MTPFQNRPRLRWGVPLLAAVVLATGGSAIGALSAAARGGLPHRSAAQLLVDVQNARLDGLSGTIVQNADLGIPSLPGVGGAGSSDLTSLVSGSHTLRLWYAGPDHVRLALLGSLGESDVIRHGTDLWTWSSSTKSATHRTLPASHGTQPDSLASGSGMTPQKMADAALAAITPSTKVSTDGTAVVAGRSAYELVLQPRDARSLVGSVHIAIDGKTHVPTRVEVFAKGADKPAVEVGFTSFDPTKPSSSVFGFNPPPHTKVTQSSSMMMGHRAMPGMRQRIATGGATGSAAEPTVVGKGWTTVVVAQAPTSATGGAAEGGPAKGASGMVGRLLAALPKVHGTWGSGRVLQGTLFSVVLTDDGRVAVGAVAPSLLYQALGSR